MNQSRALYIGPADAPDRYELVTVIDGTGGEGAVWRGYANFDEPRPRVAVKLYHPEHLTRRGALYSLLRLQDTASRLRSLRHPGLAGIHEPFLGAPPHALGQPDLSLPVVLCMPMDFIAGVGYETWCGTTDSSATRLSMLSNAAAALDLMHARQVVHGDIKPANIVVEAGEMRTVLVDYGLVRVVTAADPSPGRTIAGTPGYCAPEVLSAGRYSSSSDLYAFACTIVFAISGEQPPTQLEPAGIVAWARDRLARARLSSDAAAAVTRALSANLDDRDPAMTSTALLKAVREHTSTTPAKLDQGAPPVVPSPAPRPHSPSPQPARRRRPKVLAVLAVVGLLAGAAAWYVAAYVEGRRGETADESSSSLGTQDTQPVSTTAPPTPAPTNLPSTTLRPTTLTPTTLPPTTPSPTLPPSVSLASLDQVRGTQISLDPATMDGTLYDNVVRHQASPSHLYEVEYNLASNYTTFSTIVGFTDSHHEDYRWEFRVTAIDNGIEQILAQAYLHPGQTEKLVVDVTGVRRFVISLRLAQEQPFLPNGTNLYPAVWANPTLTR